jgi:hypothetical protein
MVSISHDEFLNGMKVTGVSFVNSIVLTVD